MRVQDEIRRLFCMELRSALIWCFPKYVKTNILTNISKKLNQNLRKIIRVLDAYEEARDEEKRVRGKERHVKKIIR